MKHILTLITVFIFSILGIYAVEEKAQAYFTPSSINMGERGTYSIVLSNNSLSEAPNPPVIKGLHFKYLGKSHSMQITNGRKASKIVYNYWIHPSSPGRYVLPERSINIKDGFLVIPSAMLEVKDKSSSEEEDVLHASLSFSHNQKAIYAGQTVPVVVTLRVPNGIKGKTLHPNHPIKSGDSFAQSDFSMPPSQENINIDGHPFQVLSWRSSITALKEGSLELGYEIPLLIESKVSTSPYSNDPFNAHLNRLFGTIQLEQQQVNLASDPKVIEVLPLPEAKPNAFTGAIGSFQLASIDYSSESIRSGDPTSIKLTIKGNGNFKRITPSPLPKSGQYSSYSPQYNFSIENTDTSKGTLNIEYILKPNRSGLVLIDGIQFDYFNPELGVYEYISTDPIELNVLEPDTIEQQRSPAQVKPLEEADPVGIELELGTNIKLTPLYKKTWFILINIFLALGTAYIYLKKSRSLYLSKNPQKRSFYDNKKRIESLLSDASEKIESQDLSEALPLLFNAILVSIDAKEERTKKSYEWEELKMRLSSIELSTKDMSVIQNLYNNAEAQAFAMSQWSPENPTEELNKTKNIIHRILDKHNETL